jgi:chemotaxis protein MotD
VTEAVAAAANDIAATNFKVAKTIETAPASAGADVNLQTQQQLGAAVVTAEDGLTKTAQKASASEHRDDAATAVAKALKPDDTAATSSASPQPSADGAKAQPEAKAAPQTGDSANTPKSDAAVAGDTPAGNASHSATEHRSANLSAPTTLPIDAASQTTNPAAQPQFVPTATTAVASQLSAAVATGVAVPLNGLAIQIAANAQSGRSRFDIRLDPAELGRIDVRLDVDRHGHVTSHLIVEKAETLAMLRQDAPQLQRALEDAGLKTGNNGLQFSLRDQSSGNNGGNEHSGRQMHRLMIGDADTLPVVAAGKSYGQSGGSSRGLDIRV